MKEIVILETLAGIVMTNPLTEYKCNICEQIFKTESVFMNHRKDEHSRNVTICRNAINGTCHFGMGRCWFKHNEMEISNGNGSIENLNDQNQEVIDKFLGMVENFTQRLVQLENKI